MAHENNRIVPRPGAGAFYFEGECLLFSESTQRAFAANQTAGVIWSLIEEGLTLPAIGAQLETVYGLPVGQAAEFIKLAIAAFQEHQLVEVSVPRPSDQRELDSPEFVASPSAGTTTADDSSVPPTPAPAIVACYGLAGVNLKIRFTSSTHASLVDGALSHLARPLAPDDSEEVVIDVCHGSEQITISCGGSLSATCANDAEVAPIIKSLVWATAVNRSDFLFGFHAGALGTPSGALLLPGQAGSGKSTLTALLTAAGFDYLSDEMALLEETTFRARPLPLSLCVKDTGVAALADTFPILKTLPVHQRGDGKRVLYMPPPRAPNKTDPSSRQVKAIVFPTFIDDSPLRLMPLGTAETVRRLLTECLVAGKRLQLTHIAQLIDWIDGVECHTLEFGSAPEAVVALQALMDA